MKDKNRYKTSHLPEDQYEPGSQGRVLKNLLGIKRKRQMDRFEFQEQIRALEESTRFYGREHLFTSEDICQIHNVWLGKVYSWAGEYRSVNISKGGFSFAMAREVPKLMAEFEKTVLAKHTPCCYDSLPAIAAAMAVVHAELVLIHPFREGNGRLARLLSILMALQAGLPVLDFGGIRGRKKKEYIAAVQIGLSGDYQPMSKIFLSVIRRTVRNATLKSS